jgi:hypothetical protein
LVVIGGDVVVSVMGVAEQEEDWAFGGDYFCEGQVGIEMDVVSEDGSQFRVVAVNQDHYMTAVSVYGKDGL